MIYYTATRNISFTSKSAGIVTFLKVSAQCLHKINYWIYGKLVCRKNNYSLSYNYFYFNKLFDKSTLSGSI